MKARTTTASVEDAFLNKVLPGTSPKVVRLREEIKVVNAPASGDRSSRSTARHRPPSDWSHRV